jgi:hypothetical protein
MAEAIQADIVRRLGERLPANERLGSKAAKPAADATAASRQDPADRVPPLPEFGHAGMARGRAPDPVLLRTRPARSRNRLEGALMDVVELSGAARARGE